QGGNSRTRAAARPPRERGCGTKEGVGMASRAGLVETGLAPREELPMRRFAGWLAVAGLLTVVVCPQARATDYTYDFGAYLCLPLKMWPPRIINPEVVYCTRIPGTYSCMPGHESPYHVKTPTSPQEASVHVLNRLASLGIPLPPPEERAPEPK